MRENMRKFYLLTLGCQMNKNDSERIAGLLCSRGYTQIDNPDSADLLIINTCSVRQASEDRVLGFVHNWAKLKEKNPNLIIAVTGCMPGRDKDGKLRAKIPGADLFFGIDELPMLPNWLGELDGDEKNYLEIAPARANTFQAFVTIQTGCNNFCSYCVVPYARGREKNRPLKDILNEIQDAVRGGAKEITLLGQTVNSYKIFDKENIGADNPFADKDDFAALLWEINNLPGDFRVHFTAADPQYFNDYQIEALKLSKQVNYLHLPAQSGDNEILKKMNRKYTRERYIDLIRKIRAAKPGIAVGTDLIVGFPGETDEQFQNTLDLFRECDFDIAYQAMYSERSGTPAAKAFKDDVPKEIKKQRWQMVQDLMEETVFRKNQKYIGQAVSVLVDKCEDGICSGNSSEMKLVQFAGEPDLVDKIIEVEIKQASVWLLRGKAV